METIKRPMISVDRLSAYLYGHMNMLRLDVEEIHEVMQDIRSLCEWIEFREVRDGCEDR